MSILRETLSYTDEDEELAEALVDRVIVRYDTVVSARFFDQMRELLIVELLTTEEGRRHLARVQAEDQQMRQRMMN